MLSELTYRGVYRTNRCDFDEDFMVPCYERSILLERGSGFFTLSSLVRSFMGIKSFVEHSGKIRLVCSPILNEQDIALIEAGLTNKDVIRCLLKEIEKDDPDLDINKMDVICNMINEERLTIKIAFMPHGLYHEKFGIFHDVQDNRVAYSGSNNETFSAKQYNFESFTTHLSWADNRDRETIEDFEDHFLNMWENKETGLEVLDFPDVVKKQLFEKYKRNETLQKALDEYERKNKNKKHLYPYQEQAIEEFIKNGNVHFYEMATGTGKTFTAIRTITELKWHVKEPLFVIICVPQIDLQVQWQKALEEDGYDDILLFGGIAGANTDKNISEAFIMSSMGEDVICISVYDTFFAKLHHRIKNINHLFLIVDEAHNLSSSQIKKLPDNAPFRLGLSATIQRFNEFETKTIVNYFTREGKKPFYYGIEEAIEKGFLSHYKYYPIFVNLTEDEFTQYQKKTNQIAQEMAKDEKDQDIEYLNRLRNERSLIVKKATNKLERLSELPGEGFNFVNSVVYCGQGKDNDTPIINSVTKILNEAHLSVHTFTSNTENRPLVLQNFENGFFDVLVAIKCFDEGVDVPKLDKIYIMASDTALRQTVQRRGRVLRQCKATGKTMAYIYDMIVLPPSGYYLEPGVKNLVTNEFRRALEYIRLSSNKDENDIIVQKYLNKYEIKEEDFNYEDN